MSVSKNKLDVGRGISALLGNITAEAETFVQEKNINPTKAKVETIGRIAVEDISPNPKQPRRDFDEKALKELSASIKLHDLIQPVTVIQLADGKYQLISGERRWRASKMAGLQTIPAYIRTADTQAQIELALLENLQREDLNAIEIALSYRLLMDEVNLTHDEVADRMHKDRSTVTNYLRLLKLPPSIQTAVRNGQLSMGHARAITGLEHIEQQLYIFNEVINKQLSVRQTEALLKGLNAKKVPEKASNSINALPPAYKRIEDNLASALSTKVNLTRTKNGKGTLQIEFYNDGDLERIMAALGI
jgi:ParB family transcriptional regulator, chromosome partitioning protein